jgi:hypothetical protein
MDTVYFVSEFSSLNKHDSAHENETGDPSRESRFIPQTTVVSHLAML